MAQMWRFWMALWIDDHDSWQSVHFLSTSLKNSYQDSATLQILLSDKRSGVPIAFKPKTTLSLLGSVLDMGTGCPESFVGLNPAIQIPMSSAPPPSLWLTYNACSLGSPKAWNRLINKFSNLLIKLDSLLRQQKFVEKIRVSAITGNGRVRVWAICSAV